MTAQAQQCPGFPARAAQGQPDTARAALETLAAALDPAEHVTVLITGNGQPPRLAVSRRYLPTTEDIYADAHWYRWAWAERIGLVTDPAGAARTVSRHLRARPGHPRG